VHYQTDSGWRNQIPNIGRNPNIDGRLAVEKYMIAIFMGDSQLTQVDG
jgi:hypothetical protein